jgi:hypothetical protein
VVERDITSEQSASVLALYMQSVKKCYVRESDAVGLKVTTRRIGETGEKQR